MDRLPLKFRDNCSSGLSLLAVGAIALASGIYHASAAAVGLGLVLFLGPVLVWLMLRLAAGRARVTRETPETAFEGDTVEAVVRLVNRSRLPIFQPLVSDCFAPELHAQKDVVFPERVHPGETVEKKYEGACLLPRGIYTLGPIVLSLSDPFGWFVIRTTVKDGRRIKVYPAVQRFGTSDELGRSLARITTDLTHGGPGDSQEFFAVRDYQRGDPLRRVHWGLTAHRGGQPVVREFARESSGDLHIFLDGNRRSLIGIGRSSSLEHAVKIAAAVSAHSLARGQRVGLVAGVPDRFCVPAGGGRDYLRRILDALVGLRPHDNEPLPGLLRRRSGRVRRGSTVLLTISPYLHGDPELERQIRRWRNGGVEVLAVVFDGVTFQRLWSEKESGEDSRRYAEQLRATGVRAYLVPCAGDLRSILARRGRSEATT